MSKYIHKNIDGKVFKNEIIKNNAYKNEVLDRLNYAKVIINETRQGLEYTNFKGLLNIIIRSCEQLQGWIIEYEKKQKINDFSPISPNCEE